MYILGQRNHFNIDAIHHVLQDSSAGSCSAASTPPAVLDVCECTQCTKVPVTHHTISDKYRSLIERAAKLGCSQNVYFKGDYGCAIIALSESQAKGPFGAAGLDETHLSLVCLDKWELVFKW